MHLCIPCILSVVITVTRWAAGLCSHIGSPQCFLCKSFFEQGSFEVMHIVYFCFHTVSYVVFFFLLWLILKNFHKIAPTLRSFFPEFNTCANFLSWLPWFDHRGWLGVKNQLSYLLSVVVLSLFCYGKSNQSNPFILYCSIWHQNYIKRTQREKNQNNAAIPTLLSASVFLVITFTTQLSSQVFKIAVLWETQ